MQDFGFTDLRIVNEYTVPLEAATLEITGTAAKAGVGAAAVLAQARSFSHLADAIADRTLVIGTSAIGERAIEHRLLPLQQMCVEILESLRVDAEAKVALLFGSEKTGLTRDQLSYCSALATIPLFAPQGSRHLSMNLGQAVAVCLYELTRGGFEDARLSRENIAAEATAGDRERLTRLLVNVMDATEYSRRFPANAQEHLVRQLAHSAGKAHAEAETWMGLFRQILWKLGAERR